MNPYLAKLRELQFHGVAHSEAGKTDKTYTPNSNDPGAIIQAGGSVSFDSSNSRGACKDGSHGGDPYVAVVAALEARCPDHIEVADWQRAVEDGRGFLATWGERAEALGWTSRDLFGLHRIPDQPRLSYRRLSRYDESGLVWLLRGRPVLALTELTAAVQSPTGTITIYRKVNKPALGPLGDSLDDLI